MLKVGEFDGTLPAHRTDTLTEYSIFLIKIS